MHPSSAPLPFLKLLPHAPAFTLAAHQMHFLRCTRALNYIALSSDAVTPRGWAMMSNTAHRWRGGVSN